MSRDLCIMACVFCRDPVFQEWAGQQARARRYLFTACDMREDSELMAKLLILAACSVESRNALDTSPGAAELFHERVRKPFLAWRESRPHPEAPPMIPPAVTHRLCPSCGLAVSQLAVDRMHFNLECPRCHNSMTSEFQPLKLPLI
jgi:hypothetical protein